MPRTNDFSTTVTVQLEDGARRFFTTKKPHKKAEVIGYSVQCADHLTEPYATEEGATSRMETILALGYCPSREHRVVEVYESKPGRKPADTDEDDGADVVMVRAG